MANTVRNGANSAFGTSLLDMDAGASLLVATDGFYWGADRAVTLSGDGASVTIAGIVAGSSKTATGIGLVSTIKIPDPTQPFSFDDANLTVLPTGVVTGTTAMHLWGGHILSNRGLIEGVKTGIFVSGSHLQLQNSGTISAQENAIQSAPNTGYCKITNGKSGEINGNIKLGNVLDSMLTNQGTINGSYSSAAEYSFFSNLGAINGAVTFKGSMAWVTNSGSMGTYRGAAGMDHVINSGSMGAVFLGTGENRFTNSGQTGSVYSDSYLDFENSGVVNGNVEINSAQGNWVVNSGTITGAINGGAGEDRVQNSGTISHGTHLGGGDDEFSNSLRGTVGAVYGGDGNDRVYNSGTLASQVFMSAGNDTLFHSGTCGDSLYMGDGNDLVVMGGTYKSCL